MEVAAAAPEKKNEKVLHKCPRCDRTFANVGHMKCHFYKVHPEFKLAEYEIHQVAATTPISRPIAKSVKVEVEPDIDCPPPPEHPTFTYGNKGNKRKAKEELEVVLPDLPPQPSDPVSLSDIQQMLFKCDKCSKCFTNNASFQKHCVSAHSVFQCGLCKGIFQNASRLKSHMEAHSTKSPKAKYAKKGENAKIFCKVCKRVFVKKTLLYAHMQHDHGIHSESSLVKCADCREVFTSPKDLKDHMAQHRKEDSRDKKDDPYTCDLCEKTFARKCNLDKHAELHKVE